MIAILALAVLVGVVSTWPPAIVSIVFLFLLLSLAARKP